MDTNIVNWEKIKRWIIDNVNGEFKPSYASQNEVIDLFFDLIKSPVGESALDGILDIYPIGLQRFIVDKKDVATHFKSVSHVESPLRKIMYIVNYNAYNQQKDDKDGLCKVIRTLGLNKSNIDFSLGLQEGQRAKYAHQLITAYNLRNADSHYCESLTPLNREVMLKDIIIVYLYAVDENYSALKSWQKQKDVKRKGYLQNVVAEFKEWNGRFVPIDGQEQFSEVALYAVEKRYDSETPRRGEVEQLRTDLIAVGQNQMIIIGEAGLGKTTSMKYMALRDAQNKRTPIYIELKLQTSDTSLRESLMEKFRLISSDINSLTQDTSTCIYLDGVNEVQASLKPNVINSIKKLIVEFPKVFFLISTRPQDYHGEFGNIPVFSLLKMDKVKIETFLNRNTNDKNVRNIILEAIDKNDEWVSILGTPLILFMLIRVVKEDGILPNDKNKIIIRFIKLLYERELSSDYSFDRDYFHAIICQIAYYSVQINGTNSALNFPTIKSMLQDTATLSDKELLNILNKAVDLNLLVRDGVVYTFSHQQYQDTLSGDYLNSLLYAD